MSDDRTRITDVLQHLDLRDGAQAEELLSLVYDELRALAASQMRQERPGHTLQPTELVHEAYLRLAAGRDIDWKNRRHFYGVAARAMRQVLVDHARTRGAAKRGGDAERVTLDVALESEPAATDFIDLNDALERLLDHDVRMGRLVELRFFAGLTLDEAADILGIATRTAAKDWSVARVWLRRELSADAG